MGDLIPRLDAGDCGRGTYRQDMTRLGKRPVQHTGLGDTQAAPVGAPNRASTRLPLEDTKHDADSAGKPTLRETSNMRSQEHAGVIPRPDSRAAPNKPAPETRSGVMAFQRSVANPTAGAATSSQPTSSTPTAETQSGEEGAHLVKVRTLSRWPVSRALLFFDL